ncbi:putative selenium metabolism protein, YedE family [Campylobacter blaseri]|uniref:YedE-related selenium metabolism membrane protein n=1 Tax=Campylobacter blaseri TaxID=2042961 RepID=A0A2P8R1K2_9BACT|nr:YedE family putative selenium transporter [Campylobacter blaseri]PSM52358.1 YedE-related selenium metabolism membrane protein [Campylobacter blaseri]PSM54124.1 YedE-related selenium metabolism membrane protein [Campylobacter blaseri]QKF85568.1 putative selenium metabolism protein, YedE family [Campylobacter blaseri]
MNNFKWQIIAGGSLGLLATILVYFGNPGNMGICAACFLRDTTGALGFHSASIVQYIRPEIIGLIFGGFIASIFWTKEFSSSTGSSPFIRFLLGIFAMIGCLVFLGCPWRAFLRLGGGDMTAIAGFLGIAAGVGVGMFFKKNGYSTTTTIKLPVSIGLLPVLITILLLLALIFNLKLGENAAIFTSIKGPGAQHAPILISLVLSIAVGMLMQKSKFCSVGAFNKLYRGDFSMFAGIISLIVFASISNFALDQYKFGFTDQPIAHNNYIWNFLGMMLAGLCFSLSEGCPGKHLVQMGSGNLNSAIFILGMMAGSAIAHNFLLASSPKGITQFAPYAILLGFIFVIYIGLFYKQYR